MRERKRKELLNQIDKNLPRWQRRILARDMEQQIRRVSHEAAVLVRQTNLGGPGLLADQILREFNKEYNYRHVDPARGGQPSSFNVLQSFYRYDENRHIFLLKQEKDHLFSFSDFIDFATSPDCDIDPFHYVSLMEDETIYSYTNYEPLEWMSVSTDSQNEFGFGAVSIFRGGSEVTVLLTAGQVADLDELLEKDEGTQYHPAPGKAHSLPHPTLVHRPEPLTGTANLHRTLAAVRFNTEARTREVQYVLVDWGDSYRTTTDDPIPVMVLEEETRKAFQETAVDRLKPYAALLELCSTVLALPNYFRFKIELVRDEEPAEPRGFTSALTVGKAKRIATPTFAQDSRFKLRRVAALRVTRSVQRPVVRRYSPPAYQVDVSGFWRTLDPDTTGRDAQGYPTQGRTWVRGHLRWRDRPCDLGL